MKSNHLFLFLFLTLCVACKEGDDDPDPEELDPELIGLAEGQIDNQNNGPRISFIVDEAYLESLGNNQSRLVFKFTSGDEMIQIINKATQDFNYHFPRDFSQNQLLYVIFNGDTLALEESALSIQPRDDGFHTVTNVHTVHRGDFNGTVNKVADIVE